MGYAEAVAETYRLLQDPENLGKLHLQKLRTGEIFSHPQESDRKTLNDREKVVLSVLEQLVTDEVIDIAVRNGKEIKVMDAEELGGKNFKLYVNTYGTYSLEECKDTYWHRPSGYLHGAKKAAMEITKYLPKDEILLRHIPSNIKNIREGLIWHVEKNIAKYLNGLRCDFSFAGIPTTAKLDICKYAPWDTC